MEHGLSQNFITAIAQDQGGFVWFGTVGGLSCWDGYDFKIYVPARGDTNSLSDSVVLALHGDGDGRLWVGTRRGLDRFDPATNAFTRYGALLGVGEGDVPVAAETITSDRHGRIWLGSFSGSRLFRLDPRTGQGTGLSIAGTTGDSVTALHVDRSDRLWVAMKRAAEGDVAAGDRFPVFVVDHCSEIGDGPLPALQRPFRLDDEGGKVVAMVEDRGQRLWLGRDGGGVLRFDPRTSVVNHLDGDPGHPDTMADGVVRSLGLDPGGGIWVLARSRVSEASKTPDRIYRVDPDALTARRIELKQSAVLPGEDARLERLMIDHSGVLWLGSNGGGLRHADAEAGGFSIYRKATAGSPGLNSSFVRAICQARDGGIWVGTPVGINRVDRSKPEVAYSAPSTDGSLRLPHPNVQAICEDRQGNLWIGTGGGLAVREVSSGQVRHYRHNDAQAGSLSDDYITVIHEDPDGRLWIGTLGKGLDEFDHRTRLFRNHRDNPADPECLPNGTVLALYTDSRRRLWVGTEAGLARLAAPSVPERRFERISLSPGVGGGVGVISICESPTVPDVLWIGTPQDGLCRLDVRDGSSRFYTTGNSELPNDTIYSILADPRGRLWISSNRGLTCFDPAKETFRNYDVPDGLQSSEFNGRAAFKSASGEMFFGGVDGFNSFFPEAISDNLNAPKVAITEVRVTDRGARTPDRAASVIYRRGARQGRVEVPFHRRDVAFDYRALHYSAPDRNRCQYKLEPFDRDWHGPTAQRQARYTNLDPGRYVFRVRAISSHGVRSAEEASFSFEVLPPFYATAWFRALLALSLASAVTGGHRWRTYALRRRQKELERQVATRTEELRRSLAVVEDQARKLKELDVAKSRFFANISHEFRTPLMLAMGPLRDVQSGMHGPITADASEEIDLALRNSGRLLELVEQLLMLARFDAGQSDFRPRDLRLDEFLRQRTALFESAARRQQISLRLDLPDVPVRGSYDVDKLKQVVDNLLGNALKFTPAGGAVTVGLAVVADGQAKIQVADTGPGIPAPELPHVFERFYRGEQENGSLPGTGIGLALARECVELHGGQIRAENGEGGVGTCFTVLLKTAGQ